MKHFVAGQACEALCGRTRISEKSVAGCASERMHGASVAEQAYLKGSMKDKQRVSPNAKDVHTITHTVKCNTILSYNSCRKGRQSSLCLVALGAQVILAILVVWA